VLRVVVDEHGGVAAAEIAPRWLVWYDEQLMKAARQWRYRPAMKGQRPVQDRPVIEYILQTDGTCELQPGSRLL
jgi:hypothetical protein